MTDFSFVLKDKSYVIILTSLNKEETSFIYVVKAKKHTFSLEEYFLCT